MSASIAHCRHGGLTRRSILPRFINALVAVDQTAAVNIENLQFGLTHRFDQTAWEKSGVRQLRVAPEIRGSGASSCGDRNPVVLNWSVQFHQSLTIFIPTPPERARPG
jgi:hypothetical protein